MCLLKKAQNRLPFTNMFQGYSVSFLKMCLTEEQKKKGGGGERLTQEQQSTIYNTSLSTIEESSGSKTDLLVLVSCWLTVGVEVTAGIYFLVGQLPALAADS